MHKLIARVTDPEEREKGFTLIELLVVIIIIGILAAIAIPIFLNQKRKAADATVKSDVRNAASVIESVYTDTPGLVLAEINDQNRNFTLQSAAYSNGYSGDREIPDATVVVSAGNTLGVKPGSDGAYCIDGTNPNGSTQSYHYDSTAGKTTSGLCP